MVLGWDDQDESGNALSSNSRRKSQEKEGPVWLEWVSVSPGFFYYDEWSLGYGVLENFKEHGGVENLQELNPELIEPHDQINNSSLIFS